MNPSAIELPPDELDDLISAGLECLGAIQLHNRARTLGRARSTIVLATIERAAMLSDAE